MPLICNFFLFNALLYYLKYINLPSLQWYYYSTFLCCTVTAWEQYDNESTGHRGVCPVEKKWVLVWVSVCVWKKRGGLRVGMIGAQGVGVLMWASCTRFQRWRKINIINLWHQDTSYKWSGMFEQKHSMSSLCNHSRVLSLCKIVMLYYWIKPGW